MTSHRIGRAACLLAGVAATLAVGVGCETRNAYAPPPPPLVTVRKAEIKTVTTYRTYTGPTRATETVELRARVKGFLTKKAFREGDRVAQGDLLMEIDPKPFQATLDQAKAKLEEARAAEDKARKSKMVEVAKALLDFDLAQLALARIEEGRMRNLRSSRNASQQEVDQAEATRKKFEAQVESDAANLEQSRSDFQVNILSAQAQVAQALASIDSAQIDLNYCKITAPIGGRITRILVDVGNLVGDGQSTLLATILKEKPIYAYMSVGETDLLNFLEQKRQGKRLDYLKETVPLELALQDETGFPHKGRLDYADPNVDPASGTIEARGIFDNLQGKIVSGLFVRVRVAYENLPGAICVPETAIGRDQNGPFVFVVEDVQEEPGPKPGETKKIGTGKRRNVIEGPQDDANERVIEPFRTMPDGSETGLKPDDLVVVNGTQRVRENAKVEVKFATMPATRPANPPAAPKTRP